MLAFIMDQIGEMTAKIPKMQGDRRLVTVLFTDMVGYTAIIDLLGEEKSVVFTQMIYDMLTKAVQKHGGTVRGFAGDSIMAVFGIPEALEDAALRACRASQAIHSVFGKDADRIESQFGVRPTMRVGISSGSAMMASVEGEGAQLTAVGNTVNLASRIEALAPAGGTLICDATRRMVEWLVDLSFDGEHEIKGVARPQKLWELLSVHEGATRFDASLARGLSPCVGRDDELSEISQALGRAQKKLSVIDLVAEPGSGKTRLVHEFLSHLEPEKAVVLTGHCASDSTQMPFFPFLEVLRSSFRIHDNDEPDVVARKLEKGLRGAKKYSNENLALLLNLLGLKAPKHALEGLDGVLIGLRTRDLFPDLLKAQCKRNLIILRIEDIHWIDSASEGLLQKLVETGQQSNLLVIHTRRPEYLPPWHADEAVTSLALKPLTERDIQHLVQARLDVDALSEGLSRQVTDRAGGNPLFAEEILSFLIRQGALRISGNIAEFDAASGEAGLPESMQGLLTAKIDQLPLQDRELLQAAATIGRRFDPGLLSFVADKADETGAALRRLQDHDIVHREANASDFVFKHVLLRDTVYQSLSSARKAELHLAIAQALEKRSAGRLTEAAEMLAHHYSRTDQTDLAFTYNVMAGAKGLGVFSLGESNQYFAAAMALYEDDPDCTADEQLAAFLADYALCLNISLKVLTMMELADKVRPILDRFGDSREHIHFLHHYISCLIWNGRYNDALAVQRQLAAMAERVGDRDSMTYSAVSELAVSCYCAQLSSDEFEAKAQKTERALKTVDDAYLQNFFLAHIAWNAVTRGRVADARKAADHMIEVGLSTNDPRSLGYGTAMQSLIAITSDDQQMALDISEEALSLSRVEFETTIARASRQAALVPLGKPGAIEEVREHLAYCKERGWTLFASTSETMLGIALVMEGRIAEGLKHIEWNIAERESEGYQTAADWYRVTLCEVYLMILSGQGDASIKVLLRNIAALTGVLVFGPKRIEKMIEKVRHNPHFDHTGHQIGRAEMILGLLYKHKKNTPLALQHLTAAQRIVAPNGPSPILSRIDRALSEIGGSVR